MDTYQCTYHTPQYPELKGFSALREGQALSARVWVKVTLVPPPFQTVGVLPPVVAPFWATSGWNGSAFCRNGVFQVEKPFYLGI